MTYTYEQAYKACLDYFGGDDLCASVVVNKYLLRDKENNFVEKSPTDTHRRMAKELYRIECQKFDNRKKEIISDKDFEEDWNRPLSEEYIFSLLDGYKYIVPQGSIMAGLGDKARYVSLSNCFVVPSPYDSYAGILTTDEHIVQISKRRGGIGYDISTLRPEGLVVNNCARTTSGAISFLERFSNTGREVGQNNRRAAQMITISVHHPDIEKFIDVKRDLSKVTGANISIRLSDEFLNAVQNEQQYELRWPEEGKKQISLYKSAKDIWNKIISAARDMAEPGLLFWDNILRESPADCYWREGFRTRCTNPCLPAWTKVLTFNGIRELKDIRIGDKIWSEDYFTTVTNKWSTGVKPVYKYTTTAGVFYSTEDHKVVENGSKIEVKDAEAIDTLLGIFHLDNVICPQSVIDGLVLGDGGIHKASNDLVILYIGENDHSYFDDSIKDYIGKKRDGISPYAYEVKTEISSKELPHTYLRRVPERYLKGDHTTVRSFLRGLYSANGSVCGNRITLKSASFGLIQDVQLMLSSIGIRSYWTKNKSKIVQFENGDYECKESYDLNITGSREWFAKTIGFIQPYKNEKIELTDVCKTKKTFEIISVEYIGDEEVFDITVDNDQHTFWNQGFNISNCSELPLSVFDSCRLLVLNLFSYILDPFTENAKLDRARLYLHSQIAQRFMDHIVDLELECIKAIIDKIKADPEPEEIKARELQLWTNIHETCSKGRRTGTGITALGDTLAALDIRYGSSESIQQAEEIYKIVKFGCYRSSINLAQVLGPFKVWDHEKEKECTFLTRFKDESIWLEYDNNGGPVTAINGFDLWSDMKKYGRRNISLLTIAPTGTLSILTQTTSGIEPVFMLSYTRRKKINHDDKQSRVDFVDNVGDKWKEFEVKHKGLELWHLATGEQEVAASPYFNACAEEINWENRVKLQAAVQQHCDHSISSTINLPENVTIEEVKKIYETAWKSGCKGITVYRKNSRTGVLVEKKDVIAKTTAVKRPDSLPCDIHHITVKGDPYFVAVGLIDGEPYEVFAGRNNCIDHKVKGGTIIKSKRPKGYKAELDDETVVCPITMACTDNEETVTRLISMSLRHGASIQFVAEQLGKTHGEMTTFSKAIARILKKYVKDGTEASEKCSECGAQLIFENGCVICKSCGVSKCS